MYRHAEFVVTSALDREQQAVLARERDREGHVRRARRLDNEGRMLVETGVYESARVVIAGITR